MKKDKTNRKGLWAGLLLLCLFVFCLASCSQESALQQTGEGTPVSFRLPVVEGSVTTDSATATRATLDAGVRVRIVVFKGVGYGGSNTVLIKDYTVQADGTLKATDGADMRLIAGTYHFYTVTPVLAVTASNDDTAPVVQVQQGMDFALSLTSNVTISKWSSTDTQKTEVALNALVRKSSKISLQVELADDVPAEVTQLEVVKYTLPNQYPNYLFTGFTTAPTLTGTPSDLVFGSDKFATNVYNPRMASGSIILHAYNIVVAPKLVVRTKGVDVLREFTLPNLTLSAGYNYQHIARITRKGTVRMWLRTVPWIDHDETLNLGSEVDSKYPKVSLGEWEGITYDFSIGSSDPNENH